MIRRFDLCILPAGGPTQTSETTGSFGDGAAGGTNDDDEEEKPREQPNFV